MTFFKNIVHTGVTDADLYQKRRGIIISNYLSIILSIAFLLTFAIRRIFYGDIDNVINGLSLYHFPVLVLLLLPILFNRIHISIIGKLLLCYAPVIFIWSVFISQMQDLITIDSSLYSSARIYILGLSGIPFLLFDKTNKSILIIGILPTLISLFCFDQIMDLSGVGYSQKGIPSNDYQLIQMRTIIAYVLISGSCYTFQSIITRNDELNQEILSELKNKTEEIKIQNDALLKNKETLHKLNQHLEFLVQSKTENIKLKNETLIKYAYANAHQVRGPVARLLGLIQLSKMNKDLNYPWLLEKIEHETLEIDEIIRRISKDLNYGEIANEETQNIEDKTS